MRVNVSGYAITQALSSGTTTAATPTAAATPHPLTSFTKTAAAYVKSLATRVMTEATYIRTGAVPASTTPSTQRLTHCGLGLRRYTHFTSPIRRYADILVHRQLLSAAALEQQQQQQQQGTGRGNHSSSTTEVSVEATGAAVATVSGAVVPPSSVPSILTLTLTQEQAQQQQQQLGEDTDPQLQQVEQIKLNEKQREDLSGCVKDTDVVNANDSDHASALDMACDHLNAQTRKAKAVSIACQRLFLKLFVSVCTLTLTVTHSLTHSLAHSFGHIRTISFSDEKCE